MTNKQLVYSVANGIKNELIYKVEKLITKRETVLGNLNNYTLDRLANIIAQTNQQVTYIVNKSTIPQIEDLPNIKVDSFMSVPQNRTTKFQYPQPHFSQLSSIKQSRKMSADNNKGESQRSRLRTPHSKSVHAKNKSSLSSRSQIYESLNIEGVQEQQRYVQVLRHCKRIEQERSLKEIQMAETLKKKKVNYDWSNKKIMFDFQCRPTKIQENKPQKNWNIQFLQLKVNQNATISNRFMSKEGLNTEVQEKVNITLKDQQEQETKLKRKGFYKANQNIKTQSPFFVANSQAHGQLEKAIRLQSEGIKIKINKKQLTTKTEPQQISKLTINSKMNRMYYSDLNKAESSSKERITNRLKPKSKSQSKTRADGSIENNISDEERNLQEEQLNYKNRSDLKLEAKMSLKIYDSSKRDQLQNNQSKIKVFSGQLHKQLLSKQRQQQYSSKTEKRPNTTLESRRQRLSSVDKYNLLYIKYGGNLPADCLQSVTENLKASNVQASKQRGNLLKAGISKKYNWINSNRIIDNKKQKTLKTTKA